MRFRVIRFWNCQSSTYHDEPHHRALATVFVLLTACVAALAAHIVIDVLGDFVLARDAYDNVDHSSRIVALAATLSGGFILLWRIVLGAFESATQKNAALRTATGAILAGSPMVFAFVVTVLATLFLTLMGGLDALLDRKPIDGIEDIFGGSLALGLSVSLMLALVTAAVARCVLAWIAASQRAIVDALVTLIAQPRGAGQGVVAAPVDDAPFVPQRASFRAQRSGNRAPPPLSA